MPAHQEGAPSPPVLRAAVGVMFGAAILWQCWIAFAVYRMAPSLGELYAGLGAELPNITRSFLSTYRFWAIVPLVSAAGTFFVLRRPRLTPVATAGCLALVWFLTLALQAWSFEALYAPLFDVMVKI
jgi:hypothetical protein